MTEKAVFLQCDLSTWNWWLFCYNNSCPDISKKAGLLGGYFFFNGGEDMNKQANLAFKETYTSEVMNEKMDSGDRIYRKGEAYHRRESKVRTDWSGSAKGLVRVIINLARIGVGMVLGFSLAGTSLFQRFFPFGPAYTGVW